MATGFGYCPKCGTARTGADQKFCASCGAETPAVAAVAPAPVAVEPPAWAAPPPAPAVAPTRASVNPVMLLVGGVIIAAIVGVAIFAMNNGSKSSSSASPAGNGGSIVFNPSTIACPSGTFTTVIRLPASVKGTDKLTYQVDGEAVAAMTVSDYGIEQQADGSWFLSDTNTQGSANCPRGAGVHTARLLDSSGRVVAQGSFTLVMSASPSPNALSKVTITPSTVSCSGEDSQVTLAIVLSGSIPGSTQVSIQIDGVEVTSSSVESGFVKQADGSWLSSAPESSAALCTSLGTGSHTVGVADASGTVIAVSPLTLTP